MHIKSCYASMQKCHLTIYQELPHFKDARMGVIQDYSEKIKASISSLQKKSFADIKSTIHHSSKTITSSNDRNVSEMSHFRSASNITTGSNKKINPIIFGIDSNAQK